MSSLHQILSGSAPYVAPRLLGSELHLSLNGTTARFMIVETEAYDQTDPASHSFKGPTKRTLVMFGPCGRLYVYFTYGMHYCCNIVTGPDGHGSAVLLRALEPLDNAAELVVWRRAGKSGMQLTNGPGKLCQALGIDLKMNGHDLTAPPLRLIGRPPLPETAIGTSARIGISRATDVPWRFYIKANPYVSKHVFTSSLQQKDVV